MSFPKEVHLFARKTCSGTAEALGVLGKVDSNVRVLDVDEHSGMWSSWVPYLMGTPAVVVNGDFSQIKHGSEAIKTLREMFSETHKSSPSRVKVNVNSPVPIEHDDHTPTMDPSDRAGFEALLNARRLPEPPPPQN